MRFSMNVTHIIFVWFNTVWTVIRSIGINKYCYLPSMICVLNLHFLFKATAVLIVYYFIQKYVFFHFFFCLKDYWFFFFFFEKMFGKLSLISSSTSRIWNYIIYIYTVLTTIILLLSIDNNDDMWHCFVVQHFNKKI